jgi:hypothetical protein
LVQIVEIPNNLLPTRLQAALGFAHGEYIIKPLPGTTPEHVVCPEYWIHLATRLKPDDTIEVLAQDGSFDMEVRVTSVDPRGLYAHVRVLRFCDGNGVKIGEGSAVMPPGLPPVGTPDRDGLTVERDARGWRVVQGRELIQGQLPSEEAANAVREAHRAGKPIRKAS